VGPSLGFKIRVGVVLIRNQQLLLVRQNHRPFWVLPGGTLEPGETVGECAVREMKEETNLNVTIDRLLYVADFLHPERQTLDVFFLVRYVGGEFQLTTDENLNESGWFTHEQVGQLDILPGPVSAAILRDWPQDFPLTTYLGGYLPAEKPAS
jgi:8-oxo-dGTP diphosphatase